MTEEIAARLDKMIAILQLAFHEPIERARQSLREDSVSDAILTRAADDWVAAGTLIDAVIEAAGSSKRSVQRRLTELVSLGAVERKGSGPSIAYRSTGLLG